MARARSMEAAILGRSVLADVLLVLTMGAIIPGLSSYSRHHTTGGVAECTTPACRQAANDILQSIDFSVDPCQDFYSYACGQWIRRHPIPLHAQKWSQFDVTNLKVDTILKGLLEEPSLSDDPTPVKAARKMYQVCMDVSRREQEGLRHLVEMSEKLGGWPMATQEWNEQNFNWTNVLVKMAKEMELGPLFSFGISFDRKNTSQRVIIIDQPTVKLGLYRPMLMEPEKYPSKVAAYLQWVVTMAQEMARVQGRVLPARQLVAEARVLLRFESDLTRLMADPELRRNEDRKYNPMTLRDLQMKTNSASGSHFDWLGFVQLVFKGTHFSIGSEERVVVREVDYLLKLVVLLNKTPLRVLANYFQWQFIKAFSIDTTLRVRKLRLEFEKVLNGINALSSRWKICIDRTSKHLAMATSYMYVKKVFHNNARKSATSIVANIRVAFLKRMQQESWMDLDTKRTALDKASSMIQFVGYPDWFHNNTALESYYDWIKVGRSHFQNMVFFKAASSLRTMEKLREKINRSEWTSAPDVVNAYYSPPGNSIVIPAGILQPPFFLQSEIKSLNYGSIGSIVGHEITHGFDDVGSQSDKVGNLVHWWSKPTFETYIKKTQCFIDQYSNFTIPEMDESRNTTTKINGQNTREENVADNGGLRTAYLAYQRATQSRIPELHLPKMKHISSDQLFFIGFASMWCESVNKESWFHYLTIDHHSPHRTRVIGSVSNSPDFARAFHCPLGSPMNPPEKCAVW